MDTEFRKPSFKALSVEQLLVTLASGGSIVRTASGRVGARLVVSFRAERGSAHRALRAALRRR